MYKVELWNFHEIHNCKINILLFLFFNLYFLLQWTVNFDLEQGSLSFLELPVVTACFSSTLHYTWIWPLKTMLKIPRLVGFFVFLFWSRKCTLACTQMSIYKSIYHLDLNEKKEKQRIKSLMFFVLTFGDIHCSCIWAQFTELIHSLIQRGMGGKALAKFNLGNPLVVVWLHLRSQLIFNFKQGLLNTWALLIF